MSVTTSNRTGLHVEWGVNRWVLIEAGDDSVQHQVSSPQHLAALLVEMGVSRGEADERAALLWRGRPRDAGLPLVRTREAVWRSTGLAWWTVGLILLAFVAIVFLAWVTR